MSLSENEIYLINRKRVFELYDNKCAACGSDKKLTCHHIVFRSDVGTIVDSNFAVDQISNLIPLCESCHYLLNKMINKIEKSQKETFFYALKMLKGKRENEAEAESVWAASPANKETLVFAEKSYEPNGERRPSSFVILYECRCKIKVGKMNGGVGKKAKP